MSRNIIKALAISSIVVLFFVLNILVIQPIKAINEDNKDDYLYHFQVIIEPELKGCIRDNFIKEVKINGQENKAYVEVIELDEEDSEKKIIEQGKYAKVDGIAATSSVKINEEDLGCLTAENICKITDKKDKILVIQNCSSDKKKTTSKKIEKAFKKTIINNKRDKKNVKYVNVKVDRFELRSKIIDILKKNNNYDGIVILDMEYSSIIGDILENKEIEFNKDKKIVAFGENDENIRYLKEGIFNTLISYDGINMADNLVATLMDSIENREKRNYISNLEVIKIAKGKIKRDFFNTENSK